MSSHVKPAILLPSQRKYPSWPWWCLSPWWHQGRSPSAWHSMARPSTEARNTNSESRSTMWYANNMSRCCSVCVGSWRLIQGTLCQLPRHHWMKLRFIRTWSCLLYMQVRNGEKRNDASFGGVLQFSKLLSKSGAWSLPSKYWIAVWPAESGRLLFVSHPLQVAIDWCKASVPSMQRMKAKQNRSKPVSRLKLHLKARGCFVSTLLPHSSWQMHVCDSDMTLTFCQSIRNGKCIQLLLASKSKRYK